MRKSERAKFELLQLYFSTVAVIVIGALTISIIGKYTLLFSYFMLERKNQSSLTEKKIIKRKIISLTLTIA
jgi:hypothetical protein